MQPEQTQRIAQKNEGIERPRRFVLTSTGDGQDDITILNFIYQYRLLAPRHLVALTGREYSRVQKRLKGLTDNRFLKCRDMPKMKGEQYIYSIAQRGLNALLDEDLISGKEATTRRREHEVTRDFLQHELMITDIHVALERATATGPITLVDWQQGTELHDRVEVYDNGSYETVDFEPDAFFTLRGVQKNGMAPYRSFFLEADRTTMVKIPRKGSRRFHDKFRNYRLYIASGRLKDKYGIESAVPRVVVVTKSPERRNNLATNAAELVPEGFRKYFLFGWIGDFALETATRILEPIFLDSRHERISIAARLLG